MKQINKHHQKLGSKPDPAKFLFTCGSNPANDLSGILSQKKDRLPAIESGRATALCPIGKGV